MGLAAIASSALALESKKMDSSQSEAILKTFGSKYVSFKLAKDPIYPPKNRGAVVVRGDFNKDGIEDIAFCATLSPQSSVFPMAVFVVANGTRTGLWSDVFAKDDAIAIPYIIWSDKLGSLLLSASETDAYNRGDLVWDQVKRAYKYAPPVVEEED